MNVDEKNNTFFVNKMETSQADVGEYSLDLFVSDGYAFGRNETSYSINFYIDIPDRPFYTFVP